LVFSFVGFQSKEIKVGLQTVIDVKLEESTALEEVVVTTRGDKSPRKSKSDGREAYRAKDFAKSSSKKISSPVLMESRSLEYSTMADDDVSYEKKSAGEGISVSTGASSMLTAGELHDFSKWKLWEDIAQNDLKKWQTHWEINPLGRYSLQLVSDAGFPIIDAPIKLYDKNGKLIWEARTDNTGKAELWSGLFTKTATGEGTVAKIIAQSGGENFTIERPNTFHNGMNIITPKLPCNVPNAIDIAFVVDATGSMGDEISYLQAELNDVITKVKDSLPSSTLNLASVFYRDSTDEYVTKMSAFSDDVSQTLNFIQAQNAGGGGDYPEAMDDAVDVAINQLEWSKNAQARLLFLVLDAPPHHSEEKLARLEKLIKQAAQKGIRIIPVAGSGIDKSTEYLMRCIALATNGTYVFLTDDSGIGGSHIKPTTDEFKVELLNDLLLRLIFAYTKVESCETIALKTENPVADSIAKKPIEDENGLKWKYYPNPTSGKFKVELNQDIQEIFVTDLTGKILLRVEPKSQNIDLDISAFPTGLYFVRFAHKEKSVVGKVILRR